MYASWYLVLGRFTAVDPDTVDLVAVVMEWLASLTAGVMLLVAAGHRRGAARRSWLAFGVGACLWSMGSLVWVVSLANGTEPPSPGLADAFYLALPPAMAVGVLTHPAPRRSQVQTRAVIDGLLVASSLLLLLWIGLRGITRNSSPASALVNLAFPLTDVAIITMLVGVVPRLHGRDRTPMLLLAWGMGCVAASDLTLVVLDTYGAYQDAPLVTDAPWTMGFVLMAGAGWLVRTTSAPAMTTTAPPADVRRAATRSAPIVLAGVALVVAMVDLSVRRGDLPWTIPIAVVVVGLLLTRQSWTLTENRRLSEDLSRTVDRLAHQAGHDRLTGLPNRSGLTAATGDDGPRRRHRRDLVRGDVRGHRPPQVRQRLAGPRPGRRGDLHHRGSPGVTGAGRGHPLRRRRVRHGGLAASTAGGRCRTWPGRWWSGRRHRSPPTSSPCSRR